MSHKVFYTQERTVEFSEVDWAGIVHFSHYFRWMEAIEHAFMKSIDEPLLTLEAGSIATGWPRREVQCTYERPIRLEDKVMIDLSINHVGKDWIGYLININTREKNYNSLVCAVGKMKVVYVRSNIKTGDLRATAIPESFLKKIQKLLPEA
jgi:acyl-CoA thioester hydrolase